MPGPVWKRGEKTVKQYTECHRNKGQVKEDKRSVYRLSCFCTIGAPKVPYVACDSYHSQRRGLATLYRIRHT